MATNGDLDLHYEPGEIVDDRYILLEYLGEGGMARVFKARERTGPHLYALKFLKERFLEDHEVIEFFQREAVHMRELAHPNVVRMYGFHAHSRYAYIVMDYIDGFALSDVLKQANNTGNPMPVDEAMRVVAQVARAIDNIHRDGYIHRDIKPGNVLIEFETGNVYLTDMGIVTHTASMDAQTLTAGTRAYMPPEQQMAQPLDSTADIYAFGVMIFEMLAGKRPFLPTPGLKGKVAEEDLIRRHIEEPMPLLSSYRPDLPPAVDVVLRKALAKQAAHRYQKVLDFAESLHAALLPMLPKELKVFADISAVGSHLDDTIAKRPPLSGGNSLTWITGIAALLILLLVGVVFVFLASQTNANPVVQTTTAIAANVTNEATFTDVPSTIETSSGTNSAAFVTEEASGTAASPTTRPTTAITPTDAPTETNAPTLTPSIVGTDYLEGEPLFPLLEGWAALGRPTVADAPLSIPSSENALTLLNVGSVDGFRVELSLNPAVAASRFGVAYRVQDATTYLLFSVDLDDNRWSIRRVSSGEDSEIDAGAIPANTSIDMIAVSGSGDFFRIEIGDTLIQNRVSGTSPGGLALWQPESAPLELLALRVYLLGDAALAAAENTPTPAAVLDPRREVLQFVRDLLATGSPANTTIDCPEFLALMAQLDELRAARESVATVTAAGRLLVVRCESESPDAPLSLSATPNDFYTWYRELQAIETDLAAELGD